MSKKLEECAKVKSQLKVTDLFSSAEGSELEGANVQHKKVERKRRRKSTGDNINNKSYPPHKRQTKIKTPSPNPKPRMTSTPKAIEDPHKYIKKC